MIDRRDLKALQSMQAVPALSILLPTHRTFPDNKQDPILVKNLVDDAKNRLLEEFNQREIAPLFDNLDKLVSEIDYPHTLDGLALFVSHEFAQAYYLPFPVPARVIIDQTFATRDLVYGLHRTQRFWVLLLSLSSTRLLSGYGETLIEIEDKNFPMMITGPGANEPVGGRGLVDKSSYLDERYQQFFRQVDSVFSEYAQDERFPLIVGGVDRQISFFQEVSAHKDTITGTITGNFDKASVPEVITEVQPILKTFRETQRLKAVEELASAVNGQRTVSTVEEAWRLTQEGRGQLLIVERNYHVPAVLAEDGSLTLVEAVGGTDVMDDAVDEVIEAVLAQGGEVAFVDDGALSEHQQIALILRY